MLTTAMVTAVFIEKLEMSHPEEKVVWLVENAAWENKLRLSAVRAIQGTMAYFAL